MVERQKQRAIVQLLLLVFILRTNVNQMPAWGSYKHSEIVLLILQYAVKIIIALSIFNWFLNELLTYYLKEPPYNWLKMPFWATQMWGGWKFPKNNICFHDCLLLELSMHRLSFHSSIWGFKIYACPHWRKLTYAFPRQNCDKTVFFGAKPAVFLGLDFSFIFFLYFFFFPNHQRAL